MKWPRKMFGAGAGSFETVKIGNQVWMARNFTPEAERAQPDPSWDEAKNGRLLSFEEALRLAPHDWHLPTVEEWNQLNANISRSLDSKKLLLKEFQLVLLDGHAWFWTSTTSKSGELAFVAETSKHSWDEGNFGFTLSAKSCSLHRYPVRYVHN